MLSKVDKDTWRKASRALVVSGVEYENNSVDGETILAITTLVDKEVIMMCAVGTMIPPTFHIDKEYFKL